MKTVTVDDGDTWDSIAAANETPLGWLLLQNGLHPNASHPQPLPGSIVNIPDGPAASDIAAGHCNTVKLGPSGLRTVKIRLHDSASVPMTKANYWVLYPGGGNVRGTTTDGWVSVTYPKSEHGDVWIGWGLRKTIGWGSGTEYTSSVSPDALASSDPDVQLKARLYCLGYRTDCALTKPATWYLADYGFLKTVDTTFGPGKYVQGAAKSKLDDMFGGSFDASLPDIFESHPPKAPASTVTASGDPDTFYAVVVNSRSNYEGEAVTSCADRSIYDCSDAYAVVVSGASSNPFGHMILNFGGPGGHYFHKCQLHGYALLMTQAGFSRYCVEEDPPKVVLTRMRVSVPDPDAALRKMESILQDKEFWLVVPHNCVDFCERILQAGGAKNPDGSPWGLYSNLPTLGVDGYYTDTLAKLYQDLEHQIYSLYGFGQYAP